LLEFLGIWIALAELCRESVERRQLPNRADAKNRVICKILLDSFYSLIYTK